METLVVLNIKHLEIMETLVIIECGLLKESQCEIKIDDKICEISVVVNTMVVVMEDSKAFHTMLTSLS